MCVTKRSDQRPSIAKAQADGVAPRAHTRGSTSHASTPTHHHVIRLCTWTRATLVAHSAAQRSAGVPYPSCHNNLSPTKEGDGTGVNSHTSARPPHIVLQKKARTAKGSEVPPRSAASRPLARRPVMRTRARVSVGGTYPTMVPPLCYVGRGVCVCGGLILACTHKLTWFFAFCGMALMGSPRLSSARGSSGRRRPRRQLQLQLLQL